MRRAAAGFRPLLLEQQCEHGRQALSSQAWEDLLPFLGAFYVVSASVYGPFDMGGSVIDTAKISPNFGTNITAKNASQWFLGTDYSDRHGSFLPHQNQSVFVSNNHSQTMEEGYPTQFYLLRSLPD